VAIQNCNDLFALQVKGANQIMPLADLNDRTFELVSEGLIVQSQFQAVRCGIETKPAIPRAAREKIIWRTRALDQPTTVITAGPIVEFCFESAESAPVFCLERKKIKADGETLVIQTGKRSDGAIAIPAQSSGTVFINSVEIQYAVNKWCVREFHWRTVAEDVSAIGAERKKGGEIIGAGAERSGRGEEDDAAPEWIHGIRFAGMGRKAKKKRSSGALLSADDAIGFRIAARKTVETVARVLEGVHPAEAGC